MESIAFVAVGMGSMLLGVGGGWLLARRRQLEIRLPDSLPPDAKLDAEPGPGTSPCQVPGCRSGARLRGLCRKHYGKAYRLGFLEELSAERLIRLAEDRRKLPRERTPRLQLVENPR